MVIGGTQNNVEVRERETDRQTDRQKDRQTDRWRERQTDGERERVSVYFMNHMEDFIGSAVAQWKSA